MTRLAEMDGDVAADLADSWTRPPPPSLVAGLQQRAVEVYGPEWSFQLQRAFSLLFTEAAESYAAVVERWRLMKELELRLIQHARVVETAAPADVLVLSWMMVLFGDLPLPTEEVAHHAANALLRLTADRASVVETVLRGEVSRGEVVVDDSTFPRAWVDDHPSLVLPLLTLVGLACDDACVTRVVVRETPDPEDELSFAEIRLWVRGDPDTALNHLEERAMGAGALGVLADGRGGMIALTSQRAPEE